MDGVANRFLGGIKSSPRVKRAFAPPRRLAFTVRGRLESQWYDWRYTAPVDPFALIDVSPMSIDRRLESSSRLYDTNRLCVVLDGDWDANTIPFEEYDLVSSLRSHFEEGVPWENTEFFERVTSNIRNNDDWSKWGCNSIREFEARCSKLDQLYADIADSGYLTQRELLERGQDVIYEGNRSLPLPLYEVTVHVDRDGAFIFHEGRHRLAIAKILELDSIPVRVMARHVDWQSRRDRVYQIKQSVDHPDLNFR